ncbi:hypothetical protein ACLB2K_037084 [Fragaria x ananassa]
MDSGPMVLNVLINSMNEMDASLRFQRSCRELICALCTMNIDGCKGLAYLTKIESGAATTITPLLHITPFVDSLKVFAFNNTLLLVSLYSSSNRLSTRKSFGLKEEPW